MTVYGCIAPRLPALVTAWLVFASVAGCEQPPPDPEDRDKPALELKREGTAMTPGGKIPAKYYWVWDPKTYTWDDYIYVFGPVKRRDDGLASGAKAAVTSTGGGAPNSQNVFLPNAALFAGGIGKRPEFQYSSPQAYFYDFAADEWSGLEMLSPRRGHTMTTLLDGRILIVGGWDGARVPRASGGENQPSVSSTEIFDPSDLSFRSGGALLAARSGHAAARLEDGRVLIVGGDSGDYSTSDSLVRSAEIYDPATDSFSATGAMLVTLDVPLATTLDDGRVLVVGDRRLTNAEVFDPATGTFSAVGNMTAIHGTGATATKLKDGRVLILGGEGPEVITPTAIAEVFDPATNTFTAIAPMRIPREDHMAVLQGDGTVLVAGGSHVDESFSYTETAWCDLFDPATNTFSPLPDMPDYTAGGTGVFLKRE